MQSHNVTTASGQFILPSMETLELWNADGSPNLRQVRKVIYGGVSAKVFARLLDVSFDTYKAWERKTGGRTPSGPSKALLKIAVEHPDVFKSVVGYDQATENKEVLEMA